MPQTRRYRTNDKTSKKRVVSNFDIKDIFTLAILSLNKLPTSRSYFPYIKDFIANIKLPSKNKVTLYRLLWWLPDIFLKKFTYKIFFDIEPDTIVKFLNYLLLNAPTKDKEIIDKSIKAVKNYIEDKQINKIKPNIIHKTKTTQKLIITVGPAGCGKSTYIKRFYKNIMVINMDSVRGWLSLDPADPLQSRLAYDYCIPILKNALQSGKSVVWDATSIKSENRKGIINLARKSNAKVKIIFFDTPLSTILKRNRKRARTVPEEAIIRQWKNIEPPHRWECDEITITT